MAISETDVKAFVGKSINDISANKYSDHNHCAHFVSHVLGIKIPLLCGDMKFATKHTGATVRCNHLFNGLTRRGKWEDRPKSGTLLIFIISASHVKNNMMDDYQQKHVGIYFSGPVYNYSNMHHKVIVDASVDAFYKKIDSVYRDDDIALYYGVPPLT